LGRGYELEVIGSTVNLVVLGTTSKFGVMHLVELCSLDGVTGVDRVGDPVVAVVVGMTLDLYLTPDGLTLLLATSEDACFLYWWRWRSSILSCVGCDILPLVASGVGGIISGVTRSVGSDIGWLHNVILSASFFSHRRKRGIAAIVEMARLR
jgi:hypothetical protein